MTGYWDENIPVRTGREDVKATLYHGDGQAVGSVASWADQTVNVCLEIDFEELGIDEKTARIHAPAIRDFQRQARFYPGEKIKIEPAKGWIFIIH